MARKPNFLRLWSNRFFTYRGVQNPSETTISRWQAQLAQAHDGDWIRIVLEPWVIRKTWGIENLSTLDDLEPMMLWIDAMHVSPTIIRPRYNHGVESGVRLWCSNQSDVLMWKLTGLYLGSTRMFDQQQFQAGVREYLSAVTMPKFP